jgi:hypothetical protein
VALVGARSFTSSAMSSLMFGNWLQLGESCGNPGGGVPGPLVEQVFESHVFGWPGTRA